MVSVAHIVTYGFVSKPLYCYHDKVMSLDNAFNSTTET